MEELEEQIKVLNERIDELEEQVEDLESYSNDYDKIKDLMDIIGLDEDHELTLQDISLYKIVHEKIEKFGSLKVEEFLNWLK